MTSRLLISVIDDDQSVRESLPDLLNELGYDAAVFSSAEQFLLSGTKPLTACLILDVNMPGMSGLNLMKELALAPQAPPIILITGRRDDVKRTEWMKKGAVECLFKPFSDTALQSALITAINRASH